MVEVRALVPSDVDATADLVARAMEDNPINVAVYGDDPARRERATRRLVTTLLRTMTNQTPVVAHDGGALVAAAGVAPPGTCQPSGGQRLRFVPGVLAAGPRTAARMNTWLRAWAARDPREPHSHFGPFAVDRIRQGRGIGTQVLTWYCRQVDELGLVAYLETDKAVNVTLYQRHGFVVAAEEDVLGVHCWYMRRPPSG
ncbi:MAG TPA: GNAT family N-acetyltransferase [Acidimicrobiia bacterium]